MTFFGVRFTPKSTDVYLQCIGVMTEVSEADSSSMPQIKPKLADIVGNRTGHSGGVFIMVIMGCMYLN